jgi:hypothetical protein
MEPTPDNSIPQTRGQALSLLRSVNDDVDQLTVKQRQQIRILYRLDEDRTVEQLVLVGELR